MNDNTSSETELLQASVKGNTTAFEAIVKKYQSLVCAITYSATVDLEKSEELAHEAFIKAWSNLSQLKDLTKFRAWLCTIAKNIIRNYFRHEKRDIVSQATSIDKMGDISSDGFGPVEAIIHKEQQAVIRQALEQIPEKYRAPLVLFYRQEQSIKKVAELLELSEEAVKTQISRGRKMLKEQVAAMVETTISRTGPSKAFTTAVIASVAGMAIKGSGVAAAAGIAGASSTTATSTGVAAVMSGITAKIITAAAVVAIGVGAVVTYKHVTKPSPEPEFSQAGMVAQEQGDERDNGTEEVIEQPSDEAANLLAIDEPKGDLESSKLLAAPTELVATKDVEFKFVPKGVLSGLITDAQTGEPVTDAQARISIGRIYTTETDSNGFYYFEDIVQNGNYKVGLSSKEYIGITDYEKMPVINLQKGKQAVKHFKLDRACMVEVRVIDEAGEPIKEARLIATSLADNRKREIGETMHTQKTNEEGFIMLGGFPPAETSYLITATHRVKSGWAERNGHRYRETKWDYAAGKLVVKLNDPDVIEYGEIVLKKGIEVKGYAEYSDGVPAGDLSISAYPQWWHSNHCPESYAVDPNGYFTIPYIVPGVYRMHVMIPRGEGSWSGYDVSHAKLPVQNDDLLVVKIPQKSPQALASISGFITFVGDKRPNSVSIDAYSKQGGRGFADIGRSQGELLDTFSIDRLEPGRYKLTFSGSEIERKVIEDIEAPSEGLEVELRYYAKPKIEGIVVDSQSQKPISRFRARAKKVKHLRGSYYTQSNRWSEFNNAEGKFGVDLVGPGVYQVQIAADGYAWGYSNEVSTDENYIAEIKLTPGGNIRGEVINESGQPINGAKVIPLSRAGGVEPRTERIFVSEEGAAKTVEGDFVVKNLVEGKETLKVVHPDYGFSIVEDIDVYESQTTEGIEVVLGKGATVEGYVYDITGKPQSNVVLYFQMEGRSVDDETDRLATVVTDPNGFYRASGLPEQMCCVSRQNSWSSLGVVHRAIFPVRDKVSMLDFGGRPVVSGRVIIDGKSLGNNKVVLGDTRNPRSKTFKCFAMTTGKGEFNFGGVPLGIHSIYYENPQKRGDWIKVATIEVDGSDLDVGVIPEDTPEIRLTIEKEDKDATWKIEEVYLQEGTKLWSQRRGEVKEPAVEGQPYIIKNITPGQYCVVIVRSDNVRIRQEVEVEQGDIEVTLNIPKCTASVEFIFVGGSQAGTMIWNKDKKVVAYIQKSEDETFKLENLPAGEYLVGGNMLIDNSAFLEFELLDGQHKTVDIDTSAYSQKEIASLTSIVLDENGIPITGAEIWLEDAFGKVIEPMVISSHGHYFVAEPGKYTLHASYPGYKQTSIEVSLEARDLQAIRAEPSPLFIRLESYRFSQ